MCHWWSSRAPAEAGPSAELPLGSDSPAMRGPLLATLPSESTHTCHTHSKNLQSDIWSRHSEKEKANEGSLLSRHQECDSSKERVAADSMSGAPMMTCRQSTHEQSLSIWMPRQQALQQEPLMQPLMRALKCSPVRERPHRRLCRPSQWRGICQRRGGRSLGNTSPPAAVNVVSPHALPLYQIQTAKQYQS